MAKKNVKEHYFGAAQEQAVIDFSRSDSKEERDIIYNTYLKKPFQIMIESIIRRWPIQLGHYEMKEVEDMALSHMVEQTPKFNPDTIGKDGKPAKAYSYCQTVVRNYYRNHSKISVKEQNRILNFDAYIDEIEERDEFQCDIDNEYENPVETLINNMIDKINTTLEKDESLRDHEILVGDAIVNILRYWDVLFLEVIPETGDLKKISNKYAKNKIILLLKEQTGLSTKDIRVAMQPFKDIYLFEKNNMYDE